VAVPAWRLQYASDLQDMVGLGAETRQGNGKLEPGVAPGERWAVATRGDRRLSSSGKISKQIVRGPARNLGRCPRSLPGVSPPTGPSSYLGRAEVPWARGIAPLTGCLLLVSWAVGQGVYVLAGEDGRACRWAWRRDLGEAAKYPDRTRAGGRSRLRGIAYGVALLDRPQRPA
jgi:hypothetical protein